MSHLSELEALRAVFLKKSKKRKRIKKNETMSTNEITKERPSPKAKINDKREEKVKRKVYNTLPTSSSKESREGNFKKKRNNRDGIKLDSIVEYSTQRKSWKVGQEVQWVRDGRVSIEKIISISNKGKYTLKCEISGKIKTNISASQLKTWHPHDSSSDDESEGNVEMTSRVQVKNISSASAIAWKIGQKVQWVRDDKVTLENIIAISNQGKFTLRCEKSGIVKRDIPESQLKTWYPNDSRRDDKFSEKIRMNPGRALKEKYTRTTPATSTKTKYKERQKTHLVRDNDMSVKNIVGIPREEKFTPHRKAKNLIERKVQAYKLKARHPTSDRQDAQLKDNISMVSDGRSQGQRKREKLTSTLTKENWKLGQVVQWIRNGVSYLVRIVDISNQGTLTLMNEDRVIKTNIPIDQIKAYNPLESTQMENITPTSTTLATSVQNRWKARKKNLRGNDRRAFLRGGTAPPLPTESESFPTSQRLPAKGKILEEKKRYTELSNPSSIKKSLKKELVPLVYPSGPIISSRFSKVRIKRSWKDRIIRGEGPDYELEDPRARRTKFERKPEVPRVDGQILYGDIVSWSPTDGYGFAANISDGGPDLFIHHSGIEISKGLFCAIKPGTEIRAVYHCRDGKHTGIKVTHKDGSILPGYTDKDHAESVVYAETESESIFDSDIQIEKEREVGPPKRPKTLPTYVPDPTVKHVGSISWYREDKNFGFITPDDGSPEIFFHGNHVRAETVDFVEGEQVSFYIELKHGKPRAISVCSMENPPPPGTLSFEEKKQKEKMDRLRRQHAKNMAKQVAETNAVQTNAAQYGYAMMDYGGQLMYAPVAYPYSSYAYPAGYVTAMGAQAETPESASQAAAAAFLTSQQQQAMTQAQAQALQLQLQSQCVPQPYQDQQSSLEQSQLPQEVEQPQEVEEPQESEQLQQDEQLQCNQQPQQSNQLVHDQQFQNHQEPQEPHQQDIDKQPLQSQQLQQPDQFQQSLQYQDHIQQSQQQFQSQFPEEFEDQQSHQVQQVQQVQQSQQQQQFQHIQQSMQQYPLPDNQQNDQPNQQIDPQMTHDQQSQQNEQPPQIQQIDQLQELDQSHELQQIYEQIYQYDQQLQQLQKDVENNKYQQEQCFQQSQQPLQDEQNQQNQQQMVQNQQELHLQQDIQPQYSGQVQQEQATYEGISQNHDQMQSVQPPQLYSQGKENEYQGQENLQSQQDQVIHQFQHQDQYIQWQGQQDENEELQYIANEQISQSLTNNSETQTTIQHRSLKTSNQLDVNLATDI